MDEAQFLEQANADVDDNQGGDQTEDNQLGNEQADNNQEQAEELQLSPAEQKAYDQGWRPEEDFKGDKDSWKTAKEYLKDGEWLAKIKELKSEISTVKTDADARVSANNKLNEARRKSEIDGLKKQQREAVGMQDEDAFDNAQKKIDELESQPAVVETQPGKDPAITEWEAKNDWINNVNDERTAVANSIFTNYTNQNKGATAKEALAHVDSKLNKLYPPDNTNARREQPNTNENVERKPTRRNKELTMADLTGDEKQEWNMYGQSLFKSEKAFLTAVKDARVK